MKYIIFEVDDGRSVVEMPVIFPNALLHKDVGAQMKVAIRQSTNAEVCSVAAGFIETITEEVTCFGSSGSFRLASRGDNDADIVGMLFAEHGTT